MLSTIAAIWQKYGYVYIQGAWGTVYIAVLTVLFGTILGTALSFVRLSRFRALQSVIRLYVWVLRGTPSLLQIYFFYFFVPKYLPFDMSERACIILALVVNASAYVEEIIRAGIQAVDRGQNEAARSLGLTARHTMTRVILPQAVKNILPALGNEFIMIVKDTSLASTFFIGDLMTQCLLVKGTTYLTMEPLIMVAVVYFVVTFILTKLLAVFERRLRRGDIR